MRSEVVYIYKDTEKNIIFTVMREWGKDVEHKDRYHCYVADMGTPDKKIGFATMPIVADWRDFLLWCIYNYKKEEVAE